MDRLTEIMQRKAEIRSMLDDKEAEVNVDELTQEVETLNEEAKEIEKRRNLEKEVEIRQIEKPKEDSKMELTFNNETVLESKEYRSAFAKKLLGKELNETEKRAYSLSNAGAIPTEVANMLFDKMVKIAPMLSEITLLRVAGNVTFTVENARNDAALHTENAAITPATDTFATVTLAGYELVKVIRISKSVATMTIPAFEGWLVDMLAEDIAELAENYIINGTGSSQPKGIENAATYTDGTNAVEYANGGNVTYAEVMELISYLPARYDSKAKFLMNKATLYNQFAAIKDSQGHPILVKDMVNGVQLAIMGYPVLVSDKVEAGSAYLGDFTKVVGNMPQDMEVESSTQSGFLNNAIDFRGSAIFDCDIALTDAFVKLSEAAS